MTTKAAPPNTALQEGPAPVPQKKVAVRKAAAKEIVLPATLTVKQLGEMLQVSPVEIIKQLMRNGVMASMNQVIDFDLAATLAPAFGLRARRAAQGPSTLSTALKDLSEADRSKQVTRPPVVTILGHVDHGKTTLLDTIRKTKVAAGEVGGITQRIGAYQVDYNGQKITFLDTPGHEAFTAIRARGAKVTDIAVLVVAADDGVMPQTLEALAHAKAAGVPLVVAINKMDKPEANPDRVKRQLAEQGLVFEEWGGDVIAVPVSAKAGTGIDDLLENILVVAEVADLKADPIRPAAGVVVEAELDRSRGPLATVLVQAGTLKVGDYIVAGTSWGRVKAMINALGKRLKEAGPSVPVAILGFDSLPRAGDLFLTSTDDKAARTVVEEHLKEKDAQQALARALTLEDVLGRITAGEVKELNLIIKADVQGSVEALRSSLARLHSPKAKVNILHAGSGGVVESDVLLGSASKAIILAFNTAVEPGAERAAEREGVEIRHYDIIYHLIEDVEKALQGILEPAFREVVQGHAEVRAVFSAGKDQKVAGCTVVDGRIAREATVRVLRQGKKLHEGSVTSLRHFKEDVNEANSGFECGIGVSGFNDFQVGDLLETYRREKGRGKAGP